LNNFLDYCSRQGLVSRFERQILIKFKVDGFSAKEIQDRHTALSESAVHVRVHRIMQRLQAAALALGTKTGDSNNGVG
jgi:DNA-directed RNA polymerase specialized sigma24 family protein